MKVLRPTNNPLTRGYSTGHRAYDFAGVNLPDEVRASLDGVIIETVNLYTTNWINNGTLTTRDYGNYVIIKHDNGSRELHAHLKKDSMLPVNTRVAQGQVVARIGNSGNSTGQHLHSEFRDSQNKNMPVEFITNLEPPISMEDKRLADEFRKLIQHNSEYKDAESVLKVLSFKDSVIGGKDKEIESINREIITLREIISKLESRMLEKENLLGDVTNALNAVSVERDTLKTENESLKQPLENMTLGQIIKLLIQKYL